MSRVTITGACGFIGRRLVRHFLQNGHEVAATLHLSEPASLDHAVRKFRADITDPSSLSGIFNDCDVVIHLAGTTIGSRAQYDRVNREGTINVARECARQSKPPRLLYVSSLAAAGPSRGRPLTEVDQPRPVSNYGRSKFEAEQALRQMAGELPIQIVRPPSVIGEDDPYLLGLFRFASRGLVTVPGLRVPRYSFTHVDDLVQAIAHVSQLEEFVAVKDDNASGLVFLSHPATKTFAGFGALVREALGMNGEPRTIRMPLPLCWTFAAINSLINTTLRTRLLLNLDKTREGVAGDWTCDPSRLINQLGFRFQMSLEDRIRQTTECYQKKGWL